MAKFYLNNSKFESKGRILKRNDREINNLFIISIVFVVSAFIVIGLGIYLVIKLNDKTVLYPFITILVVLINAYHKNEKIRRSNVRVANSYEVELFRINNTYITGVGSQEAINNLGKTAEEIEAEVKESESIKQKIKLISEVVDTLKNSVKWKPTEAHNFKPEHV